MWKISKLTSDRYCCKSSCSMHITRVRGCAHNATTDVDCCQYANADNALARVSAFVSAR